jgi:hypothetical protein
MSGRANGATPWPSVMIVAQKALLSPNVTPRKVTIRSTGGDAQAACQVDVARPG